MAVSAFRFPRLLGFLVIAALTSVVLLEPAFSGPERYLEPARSVRVNGEAVELPSVLKSRRTMVDAARDLLSQLRRCPTPCPLVFNERVLSVDPRPLGEGERGLVFRVLGSEPAMVIKISKPDSKSLEILLAEAQSARFWHDSRTKNFSVPARTWTESSGLLAVMEEARGETLTDNLFRRGLLRLDPFTGEVRVDELALRRQSAELSGLWSALNDMMGVVKASPFMRTSLSPNNLLVEEDARGRISRVHLVDVGVDVQGDGRYFELSDLAGYLKLAAIKVAGYLEKPGFTRPGLLRAQVSVSGDFFDPATVEMARELETKVRGARAPAPDVVTLLETPVPAKALPVISMDGELVPAPRTIGELGQLTGFLFSKWRDRKGSALLTIDGEKFEVVLPALGQGDRGVVFALNGRDEVIKLPKPNLISVLTLMKEGIGYEFWHDQAQRSKGAFSVPHRRSLHSLGLYSTMARDHGEPLTKALVRFGLLEFDPDSRRVTAHPERLVELGARNEAKISRALVSMLQIMKQHPDYSLSISPNNLHVNYADKDRRIVSDIVLIDVGLSSRGSGKFDKVHDLASYLELGRDRLEKYLRVGYVDADFKALNRFEVRSCSAIFAIP